MEITDLTDSLLLRLEVREELIPLRKINYQDVRIGDIFVMGEDWADEWAAIRITNKSIEEVWRTEVGAEMLTYDVYHINDDEVEKQVTGHKFSYQGLVYERWKYLKIPRRPIIALNYPEEILNSRTDN